MAEQDACVLRRLLDLECEILFPDVGGGRGEAEHREGDQDDGGTSQGGSKPSLSHVGKTELEGRGYQTETGGLGAAGLCVFALDLLYIRFELQEDHGHDHDAHEYDTESHDDDQGLTGDSEGRVEAPEQHRHESKDDRRIGQLTIGMGRGEKEPLHGKGEGD